MKRAVLAFFNRPLFVALGVAAAGVLIWFASPLLAIGGIHPFASEPERWVAIAVLVACALVYALMRALRSARRNRKLIEGLGAGPQPQAAAGARDLAQIGQRFEEALALLKRTPLGGRRALLGALVGRPFVYQLPWYVIIGAPGAGKTTALVNSGLEFPLASKLGKTPVRGVGGTRNCDWWFASEAVLIDTAGRFTTQDSDREADRATWFGFLDLLVRYRPRRPINGVLLTLSVTDLLSSNAEERKAHANKLRERVDELHTRLGAGIPIYVMVTKVDLLAGFVEFFADFDKDERAQVWGVTFPYAPGMAEADPLARLGGELAALEKRLDECLIDRLQTEHDRERRAAIYAFPQQWRVLRETMIEFLQSTFAPARGEQRPLVRGVYFTSATQEGTPVDRALGELARALGLKSRIVAPARPSGKTFFVTRLLRDVVFAEAALAGTNLRLRKGRAILQWSALAATCVVVAGVLVLAWHAYSASRDRVLALGANLAALDSEVASARASAPGDIAALVPALNSLQSLGQAGAPTTKPVQAGAPPLNLGFDQGEVLTAAAQDAYQHALKDAFQPRIAARLEERLRAGRPDNVGLIYEALKAYLMLFGGRNFDATALRGYLFADWDANLPQSVGPVERDALRRHLDQLLAGGEVGAPSRADRKLIDSSRALVAGVPLPQRVYDRLKSLDPGSDRAAFSIASAAGPNAGQAFVRASGQSLAQGVPALYSSAFLQQSLHSRSQDVLRQFSDESGWVLGAEKAAPVEKLPVAVQSEVDQLYLADYARVWDDYLRDVRLVKTDSIAKNAQVAQVLGRPDSPLLALFTAVGREVGALEQPGSTPGNGAATRAVEGAPGASTDRFASLGRFVTGQPPPIQEAVALVAKLATHLEAVEDAVKRRAAPPNSDVTHELAVFATRAPEPVRGMLAQLAATSAGLVFVTRRDEIARALASEVATPCTSALGARFPLAIGATDEISRQDFTRVFAAGGLLDGFFQRQLAPYVDTSAAGWGFYKPDGTVETSGALLPFQRAQTIREAFFADGRALGTKLDFKVLEMDPGVGSLVLDIDGQILRFTRDSKQPLSVRWPSPAATGNSSYVQVRMFTNTPGSSEPTPLEGQWALLRLFSHLRAEPGAAPDRVIVTFNVVGRKARFEIKSATRANPVRLAALEQFQCPQHL